MMIITLNVIILPSKEDFDFDFSFSMTTDQLVIKEQGDGLEGLCLLHFNDMETSAI